MTTVFRLDSRRARTLISEELFDLLTSRLAQERNIDLDEATRIMDQTLAFLAAAGHTGERLSPSPAVDAGWHLFLRWTKDYAAFCERVAGRFIHHVPGETSNAATVRWRRSKPRGISSTTNCGRSTASAAAAMKTATAAPAGKTATRTPRPGSDKRPT